MTRQEQFIEEIQAVMEKYDVSLEDMGDRFPEYYFVSWSDDKNERIQVNVKLLDTL